MPSVDMIKECSSNIDLFKFQHLSSADSVKHGVSTRSGGISKANFDALNLSFNSGDDPENVIENRRLLSKEFSITSEKLFFPEQCHTSFVKEVTESTSHKELSETDALITNSKGICLGVLAADCVPVLLFDPEHKVIAAIHAGWKGTAGRIVMRCVEQMVKKFGSHPANMLAGIGPAISQTHFEVGNEVAEKFKLLYEDSPEVMHTNAQSGKVHIDLWEANRQLLIRNGLSAKNIEVSDICTYTNSKDFFSARRDGFNTGRFSACIMLV